MKYSLLHSANGVLVFVGLKTKTCWYEPRKKGAGI